MKKQKKISIIDNMMLNKIKGCMIYFFKYTYVQLFLRLDSLVEVCSYNQGREARHCMEKELRERGSKKEQQRERERERERESNKNGEWERGSA